MAEVNDKLIEEIMRHLDNEVNIGAMRMSVEMDDTQEEYSNVSHKCCKAYGTDSTVTVAKLDMYTDLHLNECIDSDRRAASK